MNSRITFDGKQANFEHTFFTFFKFFINYKLILRRDTSIKEVEIKFQGLRKMS